MSTARSRRFAVAGGAIGLVLATVIALNSVQWIGRTFPSFLVMQNRVIASVTLGDWLTIDPARLFQHEVVAVDGEPALSSAAVYAAVAQRPPGSAITYTLRAPGGDLATVVVPSRHFSLWDYVRLFAAYLFVGLAFVATGLVVYFVKPESAAARGLLAAGVSVGLFALTGADLYGPHWFFRLHVAAETLASAALIHLALVFPHDRLGARARAVLPCVYAPFVLLASVYEWALAAPEPYTTVHLAAVALQGLGAGGMIVSTAWVFARSDSPLVRRRIGVVALGAFVGFIVPGALSAATALIGGGGVPVNLAAFTVFLFPLSVGYAILRRDLFEIDAVLRNAISYAVVALAIGAAYALGTFIAGLLVPSGTLVAQAPFVLGVVNTVLVFLVVPLRARTQAAVDRLFFRHAYDAQEALGELSRALAAVESFAAVNGAAGDTLASTLAPTRAALHLREPDGRFVRAEEGEREDTIPTLDAELLDRLSAGAVIARYEWEDGSGRPVPAVWDALAAELLVPIRDERELVGMLVLGRRKSGRAYAGPDVAFLRALTNQLALGIEDVRLLRRLEQKQASLMRADRLATLGRLTSGLAHEMGSPIGAVLSSLRVLDELGREYAASIDEPSVSPDDHRQIAAEMVDTARKATEWAERASAFLKRITAQSREPTDTRRLFAIGKVVAEINALMAHRLRASSAQLDVEDESDPVMVMGDPTALGQVLTNLIGNALDAYEDAGRSGGRVLIQVLCRERDVVVTVRDWAGGMPPQVLARIFDELYTTKDVGRGTGLGLWISRNLIEQSFGGTLRAESEPGAGSCFFLTLPSPAVEVGPPSTADAEPVDGATDTPVYAATGTR